MPRNRRLVAQAVLTPVLAALRARDEQPGQRPASLKPNLILAKGKDGSPAVLRIYDAIGGWFGITASDVAEALDDISDTRDLTVRINSPGGDVFDGTAIFNLLATRAGQVDVIVDGLAASAASFIAQAGDTITMNRGTQLMIHDAHGFTIGNASDHRATADLLDGVSDEIASIYAHRSGTTTAEWRDRMREEHWYNAEAAVEAGLADKTADADDEEGEEAQKAAASWKLRPAGQQPVKVAASSELAAKVVEETPELVGDQLQVAAAAEPTIIETIDALPGPDAGSVFDELPDELFADLSETLDDLFDPVDGYDPDTVGALIRAVYDNAPAPPAVPPGPVRPRASIPIGEFVDAIVAGIQEGVRP
jgi:ATP-dependent protease ClpP protease subunit